MGIWTKAFLRPGFKDFLYRYTHGRLHVNNMRANFEDIDRWCTFCSLKERIELRNEGILLDSQEHRDRMGSSSPGRESCKIRDGTAR